MVGGPVLRYPKAVVGGGVLFLAEESLEQNTELTSSLAKNTLADSDSSSGNICRYA